MGDSEKNETYKSTMEKKENLEKKESLEIGGWSYMIPFSRQDNFYLFGMDLDHLFGNSPAHLKTYRRAWRCTED